MLLVIFFLLVGSTPSVNDPKKVDLVIYNHVKNPHHQFAFSQLIFMDWDDRLKHHVVRNFALIQDENKKLLRIRKTDKHFEITFTERITGKTRCIRSKAFQELTTDFDIETKNRKILPVDERIPLYD